MLKKVFFIFLVGILLIPIVVSVDYDDIREKSLIRNILEQRVKIKRLQEKVGILEGRLEKIKEEHDAKLTVKTGKIYYLSCKSNSMFPVLPCSRGFWQERVHKYTPLNINDIVRYKNNKSKWNYTSIVHRIIDYNTTHYLIKGDNNNRNDGWITKGRITHKVIGVEN